MNSTAIAAEVRSQSTTTPLARVRDFVELTKPRLSTMVLVTVAVTMLVCDAGSVSWPALGFVVLATGLVAASACVWNQIAERDIDARMNRTQGRPLPAGRVGSNEATLFSVSMLITGCIGLALSGGIWSALLGLTTWLIYVIIYTPMKRYSSWNTFFGAIAGAMPVLIGWSATLTPLDRTVWLKGAAMFGTVFIWQFPHFMAIAWKYRDDYAAASLKMASVTDPTGRLPGWIALMGALALVPMGTALAFIGEFAPLYLTLAALLGLWQLTVACEFARTRTEVSAKRLLRASLIYLPLLMLCATLLPIM